MEPGTTVRIVLMKQQVVCHPYHTSSKLALASASYYSTVALGGSLFSVCPVVGRSVLLLIYARKNLAATKIRKKRKKKDGIIKLAL